MKTIELNENGFWVKAWRFLTINKKGNWGSDCLPNNTCDFKRDILFYGLMSIAFLPMVIILHILNLFSKEFPSGKDSFAVAAAFSTIIFGVAGVLFVDCNINFLLGTLIATIGLGVLIGILISMFIFIIYVREKCKEHEEKHLLNGIKKKKIQKESFLKAMYLSWKDKLCYKIEYKK